MPHPTSAGAPGGPFPSDDTAPWFSHFLSDSVETISAVPFLRQLMQSAFIAADDVAYSQLAAKLNANNDSPRLVLQRLLPLLLSQNLGIRRIVVMDTINEEAARDRILHALREAKFPDSIVASLEVVTFFADVLPAMMARRLASGLAFDPPISMPAARLYAIVSTPRSGSTFLGDLLHSIGLGQPIEHIRPWVVELFRNRPPALFDAIRFTRRLIAFGRSGPVFGTKLISHLIHDLWQALLPVERSYVAELTARTTIIYLNRRNKLDQAISTLRARKTGIWHSTDKKYKGPKEYAGFEYDFDEIANTLSYCIREERNLKSELRAQSNLIVIDYDELVKSPAECCRQIAARLDVALTAQPRARVQKLGDSTSDRLADRFLREARERGMPIAPTIATEEFVYEQMNTV